jgi:dihydroorotate dehydrogenase (fumarate)
MDLSTEWLGIRLGEPLLPGASPMTADLDLVKRLQDAGAGAITMHSLFEEQLAMEQAALESGYEEGPQGLAAAIGAFPALTRFPLSSDAYLEQIRRIKETTGLPVIASLNGVSAEGWLRFGRAIEQAGADALELNCYRIASDPAVSGTQVESETIDMVQALSAEVRLPLAVKLSPFYSSLSHLARRLEEAGASGLVIFNRFYQPDIDITDREIVHWLAPSDPGELLLRLRWLAILSAQRSLALAASGGVHNDMGALKAILAGARVVQMTWALLEHGPEYLAVVRRRLARWMEQNGHDSIAKLCGSMNLKGAPNPEVYERANYLEILQSWRPDEDPRAGG